MFSLTIVVFATSCLNNNSAKIKKIFSLFSVQIGKILGNQNKILKLLETKSSASDAENNFFEMVPLDNEIEFSELEENLKNKKTRRYLVSFFVFTIECLFC